MRDPVEGLGGRAGVEEGEDGQRRPQAPNAQAGSRSSATEGDHGNFPRSCPQGSGRLAAPRTPTPAAPGGQAAPGGPSPGSAAGSGAAAPEAAVIGHSEQAPLVPGPSGDTASTTGSRLLELYPFLETAAGAAGSQGG